MSLEANKAIIRNNIKVMNEQKNPVLIDELAAPEYIDHTTEKYQRMVAVIAQELGVTTLRYQTVDDMVSAIGLLKEDLCTYCWTGKQP